MEKEYDKKVLQAVASALQKINGLEAAESGASSLDEVEPEKIVKRQPTRRVKEKKNDNEKEKEKEKGTEEASTGRTTRAKVSGQSCQLYISYSIVRK